MSSAQEKVKIVTNLHKQFINLNRWKLCVLPKDSGLKDKEFIEKLEGIPASCEIYVKDKKAEPRAIVCFFLGYVLK